MLVVRSPNKAKHATLSMYMDNLSLKRKLMLSFFMLIFVTLSVLTVIITTSYTRASIRSMIDLASKSMVAIRDSLLYRMEEIEHTTASLAADNDLKEALILGQDAEAFSQVLSLRDLSKETMMVEDSDKIFRVRVHPFVAGNMVNQRVNVFPIEEIEGELWYESVLNGQESLWINARTVKYTGLEDEATRVVLSDVQLVRGVQFADDPLAVIMLDVYPSYLLQVLEAHSVYKNGIVSLVDEQGSNVLMPDDTYTTNTGKESLLSTEGIQWYKGSVNGMRGYLAFLPLGIQNMRVITCVSDAQIWQETSGIWMLSILFMLLIGFAGYMLARIICNSITNRIQILMDIIGKVREGDLNPAEEKIAGHDEIAVLNSTFSQMMARIRNLIEETSRMDKELQRAEMNMLQAQIQPHFLYNTLELINWNAQYHQIEHVTNLIDSLSRFYKISLSKGREFILVSEEIEHADMYMKIQQMRFEGRIIYKKQIDPAILPHSTIKLLLQPLLENAILHGILESGKKTGALTLTGRLDGEDIVFTVADDGVGMDAQTQKKLLDATCSSEAGYGLYNVHARIVGMFGSDYGLVIRSKKGQGTQVDVRIPCID